MRGAYLLKIIPPEGSRVYRLQLTPRRMLVLAAILLAVLGALIGVHVFSLRAAAGEVARLQSQRIEQQRKLDLMEAQTQALQKQTIDSERSIQSIQRSLGGVKARAAAGATSRVHAAIAAQRASVAALQARLRALAQAAAQTRAEARRLARLAARVISTRHLVAIARARMIAAIPSLNPVNGGINAAFGYRTDPFPEFHKGLDLAADYGTVVHAAAAGTVSSAGWAGSYGIKVDIDHGNGYHTWYCHLSHAAVAAGQRVTKGEPIAAVGSTGESTGPHLHYQVMRDGVAIDPLPFLNGIPANALATLPEDSGVQ